MVVAKTLPVWMAALAVCLWTGLAHAQATTFTLDEETGWVAGEPPEPGTDAALMADSRRFIAEGRPSLARSRLRRWIREHRNTDNPYLPTAYLLLGDADSAMGNEYRALFSYEALIGKFPESPEYVIAIQRELEIATRYARGMRRKGFIPLRIFDSGPTAQELLVLVQQRLPGSEAAERAAIELADFYYRTRQMKLAAEMYEILRINFPDSRFRKRALQRQVLATLTQFKGPKYDATPLKEAALLIEEFRDRYPIEADEVGLNESLLARIDESAAAQMLDTARYYLRTGDPISARFTLRRLVRNHPRSGAATRAREILTEQGWSTRPAQGGEGAD